MTPEEEIQILRDELQVVKKERDEAFSYFQFVAPCFTSGATMASFPIPLRTTSSKEEEQMALVAIGAAAWILRREIESYPDPEKRNSLSVSIIYGEDDAWHLSMRKGAQDVSFGLLMQKQRDEAREQLKKAREDLLIATKQLEEGSPEGR